MTTRLIRAEQYPPAESLRIGVASFRDATFYMLAGLVMAVGIADRATWQRLLRRFVLVALLVGAYATFRWITCRAGARLRPLQR